jgi:hypothetical protein
MAKPEISGIAPFFIVKSVPAALSFYRDRLGFDVMFQGPDPHDIFFGIVHRGRAMIMFKDVGVDPVPNYTRDVKKGIARGTRISMSPTRTRWQQNSHRATSNSLNHSRIPMTVYVDSNSRTLTATCCSSAVLVHDCHILVAGGGAAACTRRHKKYESPQSTLVPAAHPHA